MQVFLNSAEAFDQDISIVYCLVMSLLFFKIARAVKSKEKFEAGGGDVRY